MKKIVLLILLLVCVATAVQAQEVFPVTYGFAGVRYDNVSKHVVGSYGAMQWLTGNLWTIPHLDFGTYGAVSTELAFVKQIGTTDFSVGLIAGPGVDWVNLTPDPVAYLTGASGGLVAYKFNEKIGVWGAARYKFSYDTADQYQDGWETGIGIFVGL